MTKINKVVATEVSKIIAGERNAKVSTGSLFIDGFRAIVPLVAAVKPEEQKEMAIKLGNEFVMAYETASANDANKPPREFDKLKSVRGQVAGTLMLGARDWWPTAFDNLAEMHKRRPLSYTLLIALGTKMAKLEKVPTMGDMEETRAKIIANKTTANKGTDSPINATVPLAAMLESLGKVDRWRVGGAKGAAALPADIVALISRATASLTEAKTAVDAAIKAAKDAEPADDKARIAELEATLAKLAKAQAKGKGKK